MSDVAYISGPMTGLEGHNYCRFNQVAKTLRDKGFVVMNPAENFGGLVCRNAARGNYMRQDVHHVLQSDLVVVLEGWLYSPGARTEVQIAFEIGIPVYDIWTGYEVTPFDLTQPERKTTHGTQLSVRSGSCYLFDRPSVAFVRGPKETSDCSGSS